MELERALSELLGPPPDGVDHAHICLECGAVWDCADPDCEPGHEAGCRECSK